MLEVGSAFSIRNSERNKMEEITKDSRYKREEQGGEQGRNEAMKRESVSMSRMFRAGN